MRMWLALHGQSTWEIGVAPLGPPWPGHLPFMMACAQHGYPRRVRVRIRIRVKPTPEAEACCKRQGSQHLKGKEDICA